MQHSPSKSGFFWEANYWKKIHKTIIHIKNDLTLLQICQESKNLFTKDNFTAF